MDSPDAPPPPDTAAAARAQGQENRRTAVTQYQLGATNQRTPYGSLEYRQVGTWPDGTPRYEASQSLNPEQQQLHDTRTRLQQGLMSQIPTSAMSMEGAPDLRTGYNNDFSADRQRVEDELLGRLNTQLGRDRESMDQQLANKGIASGSEAHTNAMADFSQREQDARTSAILSAGQEQSRLAQLAEREAEFGNRSRGQYMDEQFALRSQPFNELASLQGGGQVQLPNFNTPQPGVAPTDILGATQMGYQGQMNQYNAQMANYQNMLSGLFGLGSAALMMSDERTKDDHGVVGETHDGLPIHAFNYKGSPMMQLGVMAGEVEKVKPDAVVRRPDGLRMVDYAKVLQHG